MERESKITQRGVCFYFDKVRAEFNGLFLLVNLRVFFYISETSLLSDICFANIFSCGLSFSSFKNIDLFRLHQVLVVAHGIQWDLPSLL